jgi:hypothetical protein
MGNPKFEKGNHLKSNKGKPLHSSYEKQTATNYMLITVHYNFIVESIQQIFPISVMLLIYTAITVKFIIHVYTPFQQDIFKNRNNT